MISSLLPNSKASTASISEQIGWENLTIAAKTQLKRIRRSLSDSNPYLLMLAVPTIALMADFAYKSYRPILKWRIKKSLLKCPPPVNKSKLLPLERSRYEFLKHVRIMSTPTILTGPTGLGKSTILQIAMNDYYKNNFGPVKFIEVPEIPCVDSTYTCRDSLYFEYSKTLHRVTDSIMKSIDYPSELPYLTSIPLSIYARSRILFFSDEIKITDYLNEINAARLKEALSLLFESAIELCEDSDKRPLIIFDEEINHLIELDRQRNVNAWGIFNFIANQSIFHGCENQNIRFLFTATPMQIANSFDKTKLIGTKRDLLYLQEYRQEDVVEYLYHQHNIPRKYSRGFTNRYGTSLRPLYHFIHNFAGELPANSNTQRNNQLTE